MSRLEKPSTRIITGSLKGKALALPKDAAVRPTRERVRMAVFNMLGSRLDWHGLRVVDLCCGSGAWGLEALSRGAGEVWLVDRDARAVQTNIVALGLQNDTRVRVVQVDALAWVPPALLDVVLADPPYGKGMVQKLIGRAEVLACSGGWWAVECEVGNVLSWPESFTELSSKAYGGSQVLVSRFFLPGRG